MSADGKAKAIILTPEQAETLAGILDSATQWHKEWCQYIREAGDYTEDEANDRDADIEREEAVIAEIHRQIKN